MAFESKENVAYINAEAVAKLKISMRNDQNVKYSIYDLDFKPMPEPHYTAQVTFRDISLYRDDERVDLVQIIRYNRIKKLFQCPCCEKQAPRLHKFDCIHGNEMFVCSDCHEQLEQNQNKAI